MPELLRRNTYSSVPLFIGLALCFCFFILNIVRVGFTHFPGDLGDARFNNYILEHGYLFFSGRVSSYWDAGFMYPVKNVIVLSDNLLGTVPLYSVFRLVGFDREHSFQLWFVVLMLLNFACAYWFLRYLFNDAWAAAAGAFVFACSIALQCQITHAQTFPRFPIPMAFLMFFKFQESLRPRYFLYCLLWFVYQVYCGIYLGLLLLVPLLVLFLISVLLFWSRYKISLVNRKWLFLVLGSACFCGLLLLPLILPYLRVASDNYHFYKNVVISVPELSSRLFSRSGSYLWDFLSKVNYDHPSWWDDQLFAGGIALLSLLIAATLLVTGKYKVFFSAKKQAVFFRITIISGFICMAIFTRVGDLSLYKVLYKYMPGYASMRTLQRFINIELLFYATAVSFVFYMFRKTPVPVLPLFMLFMAALVFDNYLKTEYTNVVPIAEAQKRPIPVLQQYDASKNQTILSYEPLSVNDKIIYYHIDAMLAAQSLGVRTLNGYSATCPLAYEPYWQAPDQHSRQLWLNSWLLPADSVQVIR